MRSSEVFRNAFVIPRNTFARQLQVCRSYATEPTASRRISIPKEADTRRNQQIARGSI